MIQIGKYKIESRPARLQQQQQQASGIFSGGASNYAESGPRVIWIEKTSGPSAGEGGEFPERELEAMLDEFYEARF